jgi:S1-C subfamily serine protease
MRHAGLLALLLAVTGASAGQATSLLRVTVTLQEPGQPPVPVARHVLLVSDNPATSEPRRLTTSAAGVVELRLRPGSYTVESDRPARFLGKGYQWTQYIDIVAGRDTQLALAIENAESVPLTTTADSGAAEKPEYDPYALLGKWQKSIAAIWSPTARATGFVVDARGFIATDQRSVGTATTVEVQVSPTAKTEGRVVVSDPAQGAAIVWVDPAVLGASTGPLTCGQPPPLNEDQDIVAIVSPLRGFVDTVEGAITGFSTRTVDADLRLDFGSAGGPVFDEAGQVVGLTSIQPDPERPRGTSVSIVRAAFVCNAIAQAQERAATVEPPTATPLPVEPPGATVPIAKSSVAGAKIPSPPVVESSDFDVALITPPMVHLALEKAGWTGGVVGRSAQAAAVVGKVTDFGGWSEYFADPPPVLIVRVTPRFVEGFWKRVAREAARTQGAELPPLKDFTSNFLRMQALCGGEPVAPVHPFVLEHQVSDSQVVREGLYVFDPGSLMTCTNLTLSLFSEKAPQRPTSVTISPALLARLKQDFTF